MAKVKDEEMKTLDKKEVVNIIVNGVRDLTKNPVKYPGVVINLQNMRAIMPPLPMAAYIDHDALAKMDFIKSAMNQFSSCNFSEIDIQALVELVFLVHMAIHRNHPEVTLEDIKEGLDFSNCQPLLGLLIVQNPTEEIRILMEKLDEAVKNVMEVSEA